jgi:hypothetical protein
MKKYKFPYHCDKVQKLMSEGLANCEIYTEFGISRDLFYKWKKNYPEFEEAIGLGEQARKAFYFREARKRWLKGNDKGYKFFQAIAKEELNLLPNQGTQVNIGSINVLEGKSESDLIEFIQAKMQRLPVDVQFEEVKVLEHKEEQDEDEDGSQ